MALGLAMKDVRIIDPILTNIAQGFNQAPYAGSYLFPNVEVGLRGGQIIQFDKAAFRTYNSKRAPGSNTKRIQTQYGASTYALDNDALEHPLPIEYLEDANFIGINWQTYAMNACMAGITNNLEAEQAAIARLSSNYASSNVVTLSGGSQLSTATAPFGTVIRGLKEQIRAKIGVYPNLMIIGAIVMPAIQELNEIKARLQYTSTESVTTAMLANFYEFDKVVVGSAISADNTPAEGLFDVWGDDIILAYVNPAALTQTTINYQLGGNISRFMPSYGYNYIMKGHPFAKPQYWEPNTDSWIFGAKMERKPVLTGIDAGKIVSGALIKDCLA
jgi:hypothetical protein